MCRQADAALGLLQAERRPHRTIDPRAGLDRRRPRAFVQATQHEKIGALQSCFEGTPNEQARVTPEGGPDGLGLEHRGEQAGPLA